MQIKTKLQITTVFAAFDVPVFREERSASAEDLARYEQARMNTVNLLDET